MGEYKEKISKLYDSEILEICPNILNYQVSYIGEFLNELKKRNFFDDFVSNLTDDQLIDLLIKIDSLTLNENVDLLKLYLVLRGLEMRLNEKKELKKLKEIEIEKEKKNPYVYISAILVAVAVGFTKLSMNNIRDTYKTTYKKPNPTEIENDTRQLIDSVQNSLVNNVDFENQKRNMYENLFEKNSEISNNFNSYKSIIEKSKSFNNDEENNKELLRSKAKEDISTYLKRHEDDLNKNFNLTQSDFDKIKRIIIENDLIEKYMLELDTYMEAN
jgi:hypothetical protein